MFEILFKYSRADYARSEFVFASDWPAWLIAGLAAVAAVGIAILLLRRRRDAAWHRLLAVGVLQLAMVAVVLFALLQPTLTTDRLRDGENSVALLLDNSSSMSYGEGESRFRVAAQSLAEVFEQDDAPTLGVRHYLFGDSVSAVPSFLDVQPDATGTAIGDALRTVLEESRFSPLAAVILASDGADTRGGLSTDDLNELAAFGVPVHTIGVGRESIAEDLELQEVSLPQRALPGSTISARVSIRHDAPGATSVKIYDGDELLQRLPVELRADAGITTAWVEVQLDDAGPHELRFSLDPLPGETELRNNNRGALIDVASVTHRVLYFEGEPRWEYKFLRRAVGDDEDLQIVSLLRVSPNKFYRQGIDDPSELESGFPDTREALFAYDALIIGSVEAASLSEEQQLLIRDFVSERGGSLLMLAGPNGLGNGGWGQSRLADVLPVRLPPSTGDTFFRKKAPVALTPQGAADPMLRFAAEDAENLAAWDELPELADYQVTGSLKPAAMTLVRAETEEGSIPLLVTQPYGRGKAWILATGGTWRWQMSLPLEDVKHEMFWRQLLRGMLANVPENVALSAARRGERVSLRAEFRDPAFRPVGDISVSAVVAHGDGESFTVSLEPSASEAGVYLAEMVPTHSGTWYIEAVAERDGEPVATSRSTLLYEAGQAEHFGFRQNPGLLRRLSAATGGQYFMPGDVSGLPELLRYASAGITEKEYRPIWDAPAVFLLLLMLKAGEWLLRRRWRTI